MDQKTKFHPRSRLLNQYVIEQILFGTINPMTSIYPILPYLFGLHLPLGELDPTIVSSSIQQPDKNRKFCQLFS